MPNFKLQGFKIKEIYVIVLSISSVHLLVQVTWWFLASDSSEIQASVEDFRSINWNFTSNICYLLSHTLIKFSVFVVCGSVNLFYQYTNYFTRHYGDSTKDPERRNRENENVLKRCDLKFGMHVVKTLFYFMKPTDYTYYTYFLIF